MKTKFARPFAGILIVLCLFAGVLHAQEAPPAVDLTPRRTVVDGREVFVLGFDKLSSFAYQLVDAGTGATPEEIERHRQLDPVPAWVRTYDGKPVLLTGYMMPLTIEKGRSKKFVMMRDVNTCCYGAVPNMNDYLVVTMAGEGVEPVQDVPVELLGVFRIDHRYEDGYVVSLFAMDGEKFLGPKK
jgi:hypothetical protein